MTRFYNSLVFPTVLPAGRLDFAIGLRLDTVIPVVGLPCQGGRKSFMHACPPCLVPAGISATGRWSLALRGQPV
jgi:hypothetical protein